VLQMKRLCYAGIAVFVAGCAPETSVRQPPAVVIPVPPAAPDRQPDPGVAPGAAPSGGACGTWTEQVTRHEKITPVATCQIVPVDLTTTLVVEDRVLAREGGSPTQMSLRVVRDGEQAKGAPPPAGLEGKTYVASLTPAGITVQYESGKPVPDDEARRVRALAATMLGWPGASADAAKLGDAVTAVVDAHMHGVPASNVKTTVRAAGTRRESWGDALVYDVTLHATESDAGMCHRWTNESKLTGELLLRRSDGALVSLRLSGPTSDTEAVCQGNTTPKTCNQGEITFEVRQPCFASP
jgi:hypothetical protein